MPIPAMVDGGKCVVGIDDDGEVLMLVVDSGGGVEKASGVEVS